MTLRRPWSEQMGWSWMAGGFVWITLSPRERTHPHQAFTWADLLIAVVEVAAAEVAAAEVEVAGGEILTMTEDMIGAMTDTKIMTTGTEEGRHLLTIVATGHDQDLAPIAQDAIDNGVIVPKDFFFFFDLDFQCFLEKKKKILVLFNLCVASCVAVLCPLLYS